MGEEILQQVIIEDRYMEINEIINLGKYMQ